MIQYIKEKYIVLIHFFSGILCFGDLVAIIVMPQKHLD